MKKFLIFLLVIAAAFCAYWFIFRKKSHGPKAPKPVALVLKKHSAEFNKSIDKLVGDYLAIKNAFVESDTAAAKKSAQAFLQSLDSIPLDELKKDTASIFETAQASMSDIKSNAQSLLQQPNITEMRHDFNMVSQMMYPGFFNAINYEGPTLYFQNCPMAFGEDQPADWISNTAEVVNPYLGKNDPKYKATMLHCGAVKDSIVAK